MIASTQEKGAVQKNRKDINNELKKVLRDFAHSYREVKKVIKYLERFSYRW